MPPPGIEPGFRASHARVVSVPPRGLLSSFLPTAHCPLIHMPPPGFEPGTQRSKRRMIVRFTTEAFFVSAFCLLPSALDSEPSAGIEPATRRYEGRVMPTSPNGPNEKAPRPLPGARGWESSRDARSAHLTRNKENDRSRAIGCGSVRDGWNKPSARSGVSRDGKA